MQAPSTQAAPRHRISADTQSPGLEFRGITKTWSRGKGSLQVLNKVDFTAATGSVNWIGGENGVGKTTLLRIAAGMIIPEHGSVSYRGLNPSKDRRAFRSELGFLTAGDRSLYPRLSVRRNLEFWARIALIPRSARKEAVEEALNRFGLTQLEDRWAQRLSLGQRQRVRLALALLHEPSLVLLDEPGSSLDTAGLDLLQTEIESLRHRGGIAIWCSPSHEFAGIDFDQRFELVNGSLLSV